MSALDIQSEYLERAMEYREKRGLDEHETLGPGQMAEIDRVYAAYPDLNDDAFVLANRDQWLRG